MSSNRRIVDDKRASISWGVTFLVIFFVVWSGAIASVLSLLQHSWQYPSPGSLVTERWGRDFFFLISLLAAWLVPITALWAIAYPAKWGLRYLHIAVCFILFMYFTVIMIVWAMDYRNVNLATSSNARNLFNDDRWCLVNFGIAPSKCIYKAVVDAGAPATSVPLPTQEMLGVNGAMCFTFWMLVAFLLMLIVDILYTWIQYQGAVKIYFDLKKEAALNETPLLPSAPPAEVYDEPPPPPPPKDYYFDDSSAPFSGLKLPSSYVGTRRKK